MPAVSLTDHGSLAGAVDLYKAARKEGVKPVLGCEVYVTDDRHVQQTGQAHLTLLAETSEGYSNLIRLSSLGYLEGYYYKPRIDWQLLEQHGAGLIALSGCLSGRVCKALEENRDTDAEAELDRLEQVFGRENVYVELQNAHLEVQQRITPQLVELAARRGLPTVATGDVHYPRHEDAQSHEALLCIQSGDSLKNPDHWRFETDHFYFKTPEEMAADFPGRDDALRRTLEVAERCNVEIELGRILLPKFDTPEGRDAFEYLVELVEAGAAKRYGTVTPELRERLKFELKTIKEMGFSDYFLIVADFVGFARRNGISVGPGRGSAAGSIVAYSLEITDLDPIRYDLLFERFLNPGRKSMPDMDIAFAVAGRDPVINYVRGKCGRDRVLGPGDRVARAAEDGLPRPAQPRRDRQGSRARSGPRHRDDPARRPEDVRDARARRSHRRLPVRGVGDARGAALDPTDRLRRPDRNRRSLPAGPDGVHPRLRSPQERPGARHLPRRAVEADHRLH